MNSSPRSKWWCAALLAALSFTAVASQAADSATQQARRIEADVRFLADDLLEGREAGTRGYDLAALYVAQRLRALGLEPAGDNGSYFQAVPLLEGQRLREGARLAIQRDGRSTELRFLEDYVTWINFDSDQSSVEAPAVFVGQGVHAPQLGQDDFAGVDVRGRIAVLFSGAPERFGTDRAAHYSSFDVKQAELVRRGAVGMVLLNAPDDERRHSWDKRKLAWQMRGMRLRDAQGRGINAYPELKVIATVHPDFADEVLGLSAKRAVAMMKDKAKGTLKPFHLPGTLSLAARATLRPVESRNVVARLPGSNPRLAREHLVFSAHLDHLGIAEPVKGDAIYNGALDNAVGVAAMLESAHQLATQPDRPKRSVLFLAVTAEEKGLLGAEWFVRHPTVPRDSLIANFNVDMPVLLTPGMDLTAIGADHSSLQPLVEAAAREEQVRIVPDPDPSMTFFIRSDQYAFVRAGVPALYFKQASRPPQAGEGTAESHDHAVEQFLQGRYHQPADDANQPIQYADVARLARLNTRIAGIVANAEQRPRWNVGDFFGDMFGGASRGPAPQVGQ